MERHKTDQQRTKCKPIPASIDTFSCRGSSSATHPLPRRRPAPCAYSLLDSCTHSDSELSKCPCHMFCSTARQVKHQRQSSRSQSVKRVNNFMNKPDCPRRGRYPPICMLKHHRRQVTRCPPTPACVWESALRQNPVLAHDPI